MHMYNYIRVNELINMINFSEFSSSEYTTSMPMESMKNIMKISTFNMAIITEQKIANPCILAKLFHTKLLLVVVIQD